MSTVRTARRARLSKTWPARRPIARPDFHECANVLPRRIERRREAGPGTPTTTADLANVSTRPSNMCSVGASVRRRNARNARPPPSAIATPRPAPAVARMEPFDEQLCEQAAARLTPSATRTAISRRRLNRARGQQVAHVGAAATRERFPQSPQATWQRVLSSRLGPRSASSGPHTTRARSRTVASSMMPPRFTRERRGEGRLGPCVPRCARPQSRCELEPPEVVLRIPVGRQSPSANADRGRRQPHIDSSPGVTP